VASAGRFPHVLTHGQAFRANKGSPRARQLRHLTQFASDGWLTLLPRYVRVRVCCATIIAPTAHERPVLDDHGPARPAVKDFGALVAALEQRELAECPCWARRPWAGVSPLNSKGGGGVTSTNLSSSMGGSDGAVAHATFPPHRAA